MRVVMVEHVGLAGAESTPLRSYSDSIPLGTTSERASQRERTETEWSCTEEVFGVRPR